MIDTEKIIMIQSFRNKFYPESQYESVLIEFNEDGIKFYAQGRTKEFRIKIGIDEEFRLLDMILDHTHKLAGMEREK